MLDLQTLRNELAEVAARLATRNYILDTARFEQLAEHLFDQALLIARQIGNADAGEAATGALEGHRLLARQRRDQSFLALLAVEHLEHAVGGDRLRPEHVARVRRRFVGISPGSSSGR